ncbi:MAG: hypothetical protein DME24_10635 [Verrucomicrobia bacterium]|nr:MAG: hypothetical protein DME24_10635 [Verrucomicrobiota bacterium]
MTKNENSKNQAPNIKEGPNSKLHYGGVGAPFGVWSLGFLWRLGFGLWEFGLQLTTDHGLRTTDN